MEQRDVGREIRILFAWRVFQERRIADRERTPHGLQFCVSSSDDESEFIVVHADEILPILAPSIFGDGRAVGRENVKPGSLTHNECVVAHAIGMFTGIGGGGFEFAFRTVQQNACSVIRSEVLSGCGVEGMLLLQEAAALRGVGETGVADAHS